MSKRNDKAFLRALSATFLDLYPGEAIETLDLPLLAEHLQHLVAGKKVDMPHYNFKTGLREPGETVRLKRGQIIILEGIHGLNPRLIPERRWGRIEPADAGSG